MKIGDVDIEFLGHSGFLITCRDGKKIAIDPYNVSDKCPKVDLILITHSHYDHCSIKDVEKISKVGTVIAVPPDAQSKITRIKNVEMQIVEVGDEFKFGDIKVTAVLAYNLNKKFHPKKDGWVGYLLTLGKVVLYHAGDTDKIPEMTRLTGHSKHDNLFVALLPVSGTYVMTAGEAFEVVELLNPDIAIPMHYGAGVVGTIKDAENFVELCTREGFDARILEKI